MSFAKQIPNVAGTPVATLLQGTEFFGLCATNASAAAYYVKLLWQGNAQAYGTTTTNPVVGTSLPQITLEVPVGGTFNFSFNTINNGGPLWYWVSLNPTPLDATAVTASATAGDVVSFILG